MGLSVSLENALSGLRSTQTGLETVSRNISSAGVAGYSKRTLAPIENGTLGVRDAAVKRVYDSIIQRQLRTESAGGGYSSIRADFLGRLDQSFGVPGGATSLDTLFNGFTAKLQGLANEPASPTARAEALNAAQLLAGGLNGLSDDIQSLRGDAEMRISDAVSEANSALSTIEHLNGQLALTNDSNARADLLDERDRQIDSLSSLMDIRVSNDGENSLSIFTGSGVALFAGRASRLAFDARGAIGAQSLYDVSAAKSGVGQLKIVDPYGAAIDITAGGVHSGEIAGLLTLRDGELVDAQARLDAVAGGLSRALSDQTITGTVVTAGAASGFDLDLAGLQAGNAVTLDVVLQPSGSSRRFSFVRVDSAQALPLPQTATPDPADTMIGIDFSGGPAAVASAIQSALGAGFSVSNPSGAVLRVVDDGASGTTDVSGLSADITATSLTGQGAALPFFLDIGNGVGARPFTGRFDGNSQAVGYSARIAVNPALKGDPAKLVASTLAGDPARPAGMLNRLTSVARAFPGDPANDKALAFIGTIGEFTRRAMDVQAAQAAEANSLDTGQQVVVSSLRERFSEVSGVSVDQELARLVELQNAYSANARVVSAVKDMLDTLMRI